MLGARTLTVAEPACFSSLIVHCFLHRTSRNGRDPTAAVAHAAVHWLTRRAARFRRPSSSPSGAAWDEAVFPSLIGSIERGEIRPLVGGTIALADIAAAQEAFGAMRHVGKTVLVPPMCI